MRLEHRDLANDERRFPFGIKGGWGRKDFTVFARNIDEGARVDPGDFVDNGQHLQQSLKVTFFSDGSDSSFAFPFSNGLMFPFGIKGGVFFECMDRTFFFHFRRIKIPSPSRGFTLSIRAISVAVGPLDSSIFGTSLGRCLGLRQ